MNTKNESKIKLFQYTMIVISLVIGMGIFRTATDSAKASLNPTIYFAAWIVGGLIAICGALTYAEIGSRIPVTGAYYKIFTYAYHPSIAFGINCIILVSNAASLSIVALIGAEYVQDVLFPLSGEAVKLSIALAAIMLFYIVNLLGIRLSATLQAVLMLFKIAMILVLISGLLHTQAYAHDAVTLVSSAEPTWSKIALSFGAAMVAVSFTYGGYQQTINFGSEVHNPKTNVPKGIIIGIIVIIALYLLVNLSYYKVVGFDWLQHRQANEQVGKQLITKIMGSTAANVFSCLLFICVLGYVNALMLSNPRVMYAMSQDGVLPKSFAKESAKRKVLVTALSTFTAMCIIIIFYSNAVNELLKFSIFLDCFGMVLSAATIFKLRKTQLSNAVKDIYTIRWYPLLPILFILAYTLVGISIIITDTKLAIIGTCVLVAFIGIYFIFDYIRKNNIQGA